MANSRNIIVAALTATTLMAVGVAWAADQPTPQNSAEKDFGKLSADGASALQEVKLAQLAIFDGQIDEAKKYVNAADAAFTKAKTDETVFTKAEADLKPPTGKEAPAEKRAAATTPADAKQADQMKTPVAWLPVDGSITIDEDYTANPTKTAAVADADKSLKNGDRKGAMEKLKLADITVAVTLAVVPLEQTTNDVHQAAGLINDGKYYEASQMLRHAQDSERFEAVGDVGTPKE